MTALFFLTRLHTWLDDRTKRTQKRDDSYFFAAAAIHEPPDANTESHDPIQVPIGEPPVQILTEPQPDVVERVSPQFFQQPHGAEAPLSPSVMPAPDLPSAGPIKETVRIPLHAVQMKKTQPLVDMPETAPATPAVAVAPMERNPMPLLWLLLGVSAVILIIQIWTYLF